MPLRLVGRRREALEALAQPGDELRVADAAAPGDAFAGCAAVALVRGPVPAHRPGAGRGRARRRGALPRLERRAGVGPASLRALPRGGDRSPAVLRVRLRPGRRRRPARRRGARAARRDRRRLLGLGRRDEPGHPADGRRDHGAAGRGLARGPARAVPARRDDPDGGVPVRRPRGRRVRRRRAAHRAAPHRRPHRALVHAAREAGGEGRAGGTVLAPLIRASAGLRGSGRTGAARRDALRRRRRGAWPAGRPPRHARRLDPYLLTARLRSRAPPRAAPDRAARARRGVRRARPDRRRGRPAADRVGRDAVTVRSVRSCAYGAAQRGFVPSARKSAMPAATAAGSRPSRSSGSSRAARATSST